eukprot:CAMPEP_0116145250 /NCGR_PEP_ID=MMETSP0329-20121206/16482_1 /TAXON_ID=697910 /ORGANISM="Pseudo-nitzschia arenysensis, Strain B593" /LENGTH=524 /DNA_ID=CAMNT_0003640821 /DNA_START=86 /DNA_END=1660 /DNA_ORIENTATION=+
MKSSSIFRLVFFFIVAIFALNFVVVLIYFPLSPSSTSSLEVSPLTLKLQSRGAFGNFQNEKLLEEHQRHQQLAPRKEDAKPEQQLRKGAKDRIQKPKTQTKSSAKIETKSTANNKGTNSKTFGKIENSTQNCESYGCPVYPPELTTPLTNQTIWKTVVEAGKNSSNQLVSNFSFASETYAILSQQGASHKFNQDRGLYVSPFLPELFSSSSTTKDTTTKSFLTAIFDGHGNLGHKVAQELVEKFPILLGEKLTLALSGNKINGRGERRNTSIVVDKLDYDSTDRAIRKALNESFLELNEKGDPANFYLGGSTASVALRWGSSLYIANTGDSETVVISASPPPKQQNTKQKQQHNKLWNAKVEYATRRDKANQPEERARIEKLGGKIHINDKGFDPRVILHSEVAQDTIGLAMSRSIGDWEWKAVGVIAEPTIDVIDLTKLLPLSDTDDKTIFLLAASDGFWEERKKPFYAARLAASFGKDDDDERNRNASLRPLYHLYDMIQKITPKNQNGYRDDITVAIVNLA